MHLPGGMKTAIMGAEVVAGAALARIVESKIPASEDGASEAGTLFGQPAGLVVGGGLLVAALFAGSEIGKHLAAIGFGALSPTLAAKLSATVTGEGAISGYPAYSLGQLPYGASVYALPPGNQPIYANPAAVAGLV